MWQQIRKPLICHENKNIIKESVTSTEKALPTKASFHVKMWAILTWKEALFICPWHTGVKQASSQLHLWLRPVRPTLAGRKQNWHRWACGGCSAARDPAPLGHTVWKQKFQQLVTKSWIQQTSPCTANVRIKNEILLILSEHLNKFYNYLSDFATHVPLCVCQKSCIDVCFTYHKVHPF